MASNTQQASAAECIETNIPGRLDRLPWSRWHILIVVALGITWLLDGLEGNLAGSLAGILKRRDTLGFTDAQLGLSATYYLAGAVAGAIVFGYLTDRFGRRKLFFITLLLYLSATAATAASWSFASFTFFRSLTGAGIGGEYAAVNSAVDELIPARAEVTLIYLSIRLSGLAPLWVPVHRCCCWTPELCHLPSGGGWPS